MAGAIKEIQAIERHMQELGDKYQAQQKGKVVLSFIFSAFLLCHANYYNIQLGHRTHWG